MAAAPAATAADAGAAAASAAGTAGRSEVGEGASIPVHCGLWCSD